MWVFEFVLSAEEREKEWLKRVGTPARLELSQEGTTELDVALSTRIVEAIKAMRSGSDYTIMFYFGSEGAKERHLSKDAREPIYRLILELVKGGTIREYKRIICFDHDLLANDHELKSGVLRVGEGLGTIDRTMGEHCRLMMETKGCSLYVAPVVVRSNVALYGVDKVSISLVTTDRDTGGRGSAGLIFFCDPPNGEIIEQFRQMERATERRMVAVHKVVFPEDKAAMAQTASR